MYVVPDIEKPKGTVKMVILFKLTPSVSSEMSF